MDFFVVCATIIPVLFLALIYQVELFKRPSNRNTSTWERLLAFADVALLGVVALVAEASALHALSAGHASHGEQSTVKIGTWALAAFTFLMPPVVQAVEATHQIANQRHKGLVRLGVLAAVVVIGVLVVVLNPL